MIIPNKEIVDITILAEYLNLIAISKVMLQITTSVKIILRRKLETEFRNSIRIFQGNGRKLILVPDDITIQDAFCAIQGLK